MNDFESKNLNEEVIKEKWTSMCNSDGVTFTEKVTGLCTIMGHYYMQVLECADDLYMRFILEEFFKTKGEKLHENSWVLHYTEEVPDQHFRDYTVKSMPAQQANKEIKNWNQFEKVHHIYYALVNIGDQLAIM